MSLAPSTKNMKEERDAPHTHIPFITYRGTVIYQNCWVFSSTPLSSLKWNILVAAVRGQWMPYVIIDNFQPLKCMYKNALYFCMGKTPVLLLYFRKNFQNYFRNIHQPIIVTLDCFSCFRVTSLNPSPSIHHINCIHTVCQFNRAFSMCKSFSMCKTSDVIGG